MNKSVTIFGPEFSTYVRSVLICCEEKGIQYQRQDINFGSNELLTLNPFGKVPVLTHNDLTLYESVAIGFYIEIQFKGPSLLPSNTNDLVTMHQWISIANCYLDRAFIRQYVLEFAFPSGQDGQVNDAKIKQANKKIPSYLKSMTQHLSKHNYFSGKDAGLADYIIIPMLHYLGKTPLGNEHFTANPLISDYVNRLLQRESCLKILV